MKKTNLVIAVSAAALILCSCSSTEKTENVQSSENTQNSANTQDSVMESGTLQSSEAAPLADGYAFEDSGAAEAKFIADEDYGFTSDDGAFTVRLDGEPEKSGDILTFDFICENNTDKTVQEIFSVWVSMLKINDVGYPYFDENAEAVDSSESSEVSEELAPGEAAHYTVSYDLTYTNKADFRDDEEQLLWHEGEANDIYIRYSPTLKVTGTDGNEVTYTASESPLYATVE